MLWLPGAEGWNDLLSHHRAVSLYRHHHPQFLLARARDRPHVPKVHMLHRLERAEEQAGQPEHTSGRPGTAP